MPQERPPRDAATLVVLRDAAGGPQVLLMQRPETRDHTSGAWVFPGGVVDPQDRVAQACCSGLDDAQASALLGVPQGGLGFHVAALRECFEESGLLFAQPLPAGDDAPWDGWRERLHRGERTLADFCRDTGLRFAVDRIAYLSHWVTPLGRAKRFDTRFFVALAPAGQRARHDGREMLDHRWLGAAEALAQGDALKLMGPTRATLQWLSAFDSAQAALDAARRPREIPRTLPRTAQGPSGERPVLPHEPAWEEIGRLDPTGQGLARHDIRAGVPVRLSPRVIRVTAPNAGVMTGPGTNSYLVGGGARNEWAVIDPGPADAAHVDALLAAAPGAIRWIFATHTHSDHSPAAVPLQARTGAAVLGRRPLHPDRQDPHFAPQRELQHGERCRLDGATLRVIHTPGHASNHLCFLLEEERLLFTGDHVMQSSTVVINPPDGDMAAYLTSLQALRDEPVDWLAPGHGFLMAQPVRVFDALVAHRLKREAKVRQALQTAGPATAEALLPAVYDDVDPRLLPIALRSLTAHLLKLRGDGLAAADEHAGSVTWRPAGP